MRTMEDDDSNMEKLDNLVIGVFAKLFVFVLNMTYLFIFIVYFLFCAVTV